MGIALVKESLGREWAHVSPFARLALVHMATTALDRSTPDHPGRSYFAGHDALILALCGLVDGAPGYESARKRVRRAIGELLAAGAIARIVEATNGHRAVYTITTDAPTLVDNSTAGTASKVLAGVVEGDMGVPHIGRTRGRTKGATR